MRFVTGDGVAVTDLPEWARGRAGGLVVAPQGVALIRRGEGTAVPWEQVLGLVVAADGSRAWILAPRHPPDRPWLEVRPSDLPESLRAGGLAALERAYEQHRNPGYRDRAVAADPTREAPADLSLTGILEEQPAEVPVLVPAGRRWKAGMLASVLGAIPGSLLALRVALPMGDPALLAPAMIAGGLLFGSALFGLTAGPRPRRRALVVGPWGLAIEPPESAERVSADAALADALDTVGSRRTFAWRDVQRVWLQREGGEPILVIDGAPGTTLAMVSLAGSDVPPELVVGIAEAYRARLRGEPVRVRVDAAETAQEERAEPAEAAESTRWTKR